MMLFTCLLLIKILLWKLFTIFKWCKTCAHWIKEQKKNFVEKKNFHRNFWLKFDISHGVNMRKVHCLPTLSVKKIFWDLKSKIRFHSFVRLDLEHRLNTHNMVISLELKAKKIKVKKSKTSWMPFWNNRLQMTIKRRCSSDMGNFLAPIADKHNPCLIVIRFGK